MTQPPTLPPPIAAFIQAHNARSVRAVGLCFAEDAIVRDEGGTHVGRRAIEQWFDDASRRYAMQLDPVAIAPHGTELVLSATVSGKFPGSPADLRFIFALEAERIVALQITA